jgi:two-component system sensor histidine kinase TrcS
MLSVSALVMIVVLAVGALSVYTLRGYVTAVSDVEVTHSLKAFRHAFVDTPPADGKRLTDVTGQASGTIIAVLRHGRIAQAAMFDDAGPRPVPASAIAGLEAANWVGSGTQTVDLGAGSAYRVASADIGGGVRLISAISLRSADQAIAKKTAAVVVITIAAAMLAAAGTVVLVRRALRPLRRVAATAARAATTIPSGDTEQRLTARVRRADSNPDNEVGIVGETLNRLLANVDATLAARAESDRRMRRFLTDASHELRTPLAAIQGYAELTRQDGPSLPDTTEYALARIESESRRMNSLVDDMLLLSRLDEKRGLDLERIDLCALVADAINDVAVTAPGHRFLADLPDDAVWVHGDRARLHQVVGNLLTNACKHTPTGVTVTTTIGESSAERGQFVTLAVSDDGPGIDPALIPELFDRFVRADTSRSRALNSTGLGLAIVASIAEAHGGRAKAQSEPGATTFTVILPAPASRNEHPCAGGNR